MYRKITQEQEEITHDPPVTELANHSFLKLPEEAILKLAERTNWTNLLSWDQNRSHIDAAVFAD